jgi:hypothetical protein
MAVKPADPLMRTQSLIRCSLKLLPSPQTFSAYASRLDAPVLHSSMTLPVRREKRSVWLGVPLLAFLRHGVRRITTPAITQHRKAIGNVHAARQNRACDDRGLLQGCPAGTKGISHQFLQRGEESALSSPYTAALRCRGYRT